MHRRELLKGFLVLGACPLCARLAFAAEGAHWSYEGEAGPDHWGGLAKENAACSAGSQQSPLDIVGATDRALPDECSARTTGEPPFHPGVGITAAPKTCAARVFAA